MAQMIIMLRKDPDTGKQNIIVKLDSDPDALPVEHEQMHRQLVQKLTGLKPEDMGEVIITREGEVQPTQPPPTSTDEDARRKEGNKG
jgi:hypothetical protein